MDKIDEAIKKEFDRFNKTAPIIPERSDVKKCPLKIVYSLPNDCMGSECAWYDQKYRCCALLSLARKR